MNRLLAGVDVGGSHSEAVVALGSGPALARLSGPAAALEPGKITSSAAVVVELIRDTHKEAGIRTAVDAVVVGAAGAGRSELRSEFAALLKGHFGPNCAIEVTSDAAIALESAFGSGSGILVASGSGSIAFARDPHGTIWQVGGLGWRHGDQGSGYSLAVAALEVLEGGGDIPSNGAMSTALGEALGAAAISEALRELRGGDRTRVATIARAVIEAAGGGHRQARELLADTAYQLARHLHALVDRFPPETRPIPVAFSGGMLREGSLVRDDLRALIEHEVADLQFANVAVDPPLGALALAQRLPGRAGSAPSGRQT